MNPATYREVKFGDRTVRVTIWFGRGLAVVDPMRQEGVSANQVRTWVAHKNHEICLYWAVIDPEPPKSLSQIGLALRGYAAFLDPHIERPSALDNEPFDYVPPPGEYNWDENDPYGWEGCPPDPEWRDG